MPSSELLSKIKNVIRGEEAGNEEEPPDGPAIVDATVLGELINDTYALSGKSTDDVAEWLLRTIEDYDDTDDRGEPKKPRDKKVSMRSFANFIDKRMKRLRDIFGRLDTDQDATITLPDVYAYLQQHKLDYDPKKVEEVFSVFDKNKTGRVSFDDFARHLILVPRYGRKSEEDYNHRFFYRAYDFFVDDLELSADSDVILSNEMKNGLGYFWAGGVAGVISRTSTAPFDRLKVFLITNSTAQSPISMREAIYAIYKNGNPSGLRAFFTGNGLNIIKVFPESAVKFGGFEMAKRIFAQIEGVDDPANLSRGSVFIAGGLGGMISQLVVYPIDTVKFRVQSAIKDGRPSNGHGVLWNVVMDMWKEQGIRPFYRGLYVGVLGIFPFAALDLGIFSIFKTTYVRQRAKRLGLDPSEVTPGNLPVLCMGAVSGSVGATVVYPINLVRTRIQTQGTPAHPYRYKGFIDCWQQTVSREGWRGLFRGLGPNILKVAPSVSISYVVYEKSKALMGLP